MEPDKELLPSGLEATLERLYNDQQRSGADDVSARKQVLNTLLDQSLE